MDDIVLRDALMVLPDRVQPGWIRVADGRIDSIGTGAVPSASTSVDCNGNLVLPGRIEPHAHLRPNELSSDLEDVTRQALAGGVTTVMAYVRTRDSYLEALPRWEMDVREHALCDVGFHLQIQTRQHIDEIPLCHARHGIASYELHVDSRRPVGPVKMEPVDDGDVYLTMRAVREFGGIVSVHCEDSEITRYLLPEADGIGLSAWESVRPPLVEAADINNIVFLASQMGSRVLFLHVSSAESLEVLRLHRYRNAIVEVLVRHLTMDIDEADARLGRWGKSRPPTRSRSQVDRMWESVRRDEVDFVGTDHSTYVGVVPADAKPTHESFWTPGPRAMGGIGLAVPLMLTAARERNLSLPAVVELLSGRVADTFNLPNKGRIVPGADADLVVVDLTEEREVTPGMPASAGFSVANGRRLIGWPVLTMLRGAIVFDEHGRASQQRAEVIRPG